VVLWNRCVVWQGSGGAADMLADAISKLPEGSIDDDAWFVLYMYS